MLDGHEALIGYHFTNNACKWPDGILHLNPLKMLQVVRL